MSSSPNRLLCCTIVSSASSAADDESKPAEFNSGTRTGGLHAWTAAAVPPTSTAPRNQVLKMSLGGRQPFPLG